MKGTVVISEVQLIWLLFARLLLLEQSRGVMLGRIVNFLSHTMNRNFDSDRCGRGGLGFTCSSNPPEIPSDWCFSNCVLQCERRELHVRKKMKGWEAKI